MKRSIKIAILTATIITIIVVVLAVLFGGISRPGPRTRISILEVSLEWEYNELFRYYYIKTSTMKVKHNGASDLWDAYIFGEIDGQSFGGSVPALEPGETRTFNPGFGGVMISGTGSYTLTLRVENIMRTELYGEHTIDIHVP